MFVLARRWKPSRTPWTAAIFMPSIPALTADQPKDARRPQGLRARLSKKAKKEKKSPGKKLEKGVVNPFFI